MIYVVQQFNNCKEMRTNVPFQLNLSATTSVSTLSVGVRGTGLVDCLHIRSAINVMYNEY